MSNHTAVLPHHHELLEASALARDPKVVQAKKALLDAVKEHRQKLTGVRPPNPALKQSYEQTLAAFTECRGSKLWFPYIGSGIGNGSLVELLDGSVKYDFICGIGPHYLGHSNLDLIAASLDAALNDTIMQGHLQQNGDSLEFSQLLIKASKLPHCFLTTSGVMANENAIKLAFQKKYPAHRILAFERCFIGRTLAMSQITDKPAFREGLPPSLYVDYVPYYDPAKPEESTSKAVAALKKHIYRYPRDHAVMVFELVQGEGGFYHGTHEFFMALIDVLRENKIPVFMDEVQTFGRTTELFAFQHFGLQDYVDICTIGKLSQVCATLFTKEFAPKPGLLSQTFTGSTSAIHAGKVIVQTLLEGNFYGPKGKVQQIHDHFAKNLQELANRHPKLIQGPWGIGSMIAFTPLDGETQRVTKFVHQLFDAGVLSFVAGANPTRVRFLPPAGAVTAQDIDNATKILEEVLIKEGSK